MQKYSFCQRLFVSVRHPSARILYPKSVKDKINYLSKYLKIINNVLYILLKCNKIQIMIKFHKRHYIWLSMFSLIIGIGIYLFFRSLNILFFELIPKQSFFGMIYKPLHPSVLTNIIIYNLPDMFWLLSGIFLLRFIWFDKKKIQKVYIFSFYGIALFFEILQLYNFIPGTFDLMDLIFMSIGAFVEGYIYKNFINRRFLCSKKYYRI